MMTLIRRTAIQTKYVFEPTPTAQQIHDDFDIMAQRALDTVKATLEKADLDSITQRVNMLKSAGFTNMQEVKEHSKKLAEYTKAKSFVSAAEGYALKYPNYKFVTLETVVALCKKYALMCAPVGKYKGDVPQKNLLEIANFSVKPEDTYYEKWSRNDRNHADVTDPGRFVNTSEQSRYDTNGQPVSKFICAPSDHFEIDKEDKVFGEVFVTRFIHDPIVLHYVKDGFLVVSKWGPEASEPALVNEKMN